MKHVKPLEFCQIWWPLARMRRGLVATLLLATGAMAVQAQSIVVKHQGT